MSSPQKNDITSSPILTFNTHSFKHSRKRRLFNDKKISDVQVHNKKVKLQTDNDVINTNKSKNVLKLNLLPTATNEIHSLGEGSNNIIVDYKNENDINVHAKEVVNTKNNDIFATKTPQDLLKSRITVIKSFVQKPSIYSDYTIHNFNKTIVSRKKIAQDLLSCAKSLEDANVVDALKKISSKNCSKGFIALNKFSNTSGSIIEYNKQDTSSVDNASNNCFKLEQIDTNIIDPNISSTNVQHNPNAEDVLKELANKEIIFSQWQFPNKEIIASDNVLQTVNKRKAPDIPSVNIEINVIVPPPCRIVTSQDEFDQFEKLNNNSKNLIDKYDEDSNGSSGYNYDKQDISADQFDNIETAKALSEIDKSKKNQNMFMKISKMDNSFTKQSAEINNIGTDKVVIDEEPSEKPICSSVAIDSIINSNTNETQKNTLKPPSEISSFKGFATASGKSITIDEEFLHKAKKLFSDIEDNNTDKVTTNEIIPTGFQGFGTASGKQVKINHKSLEQARKLFADIEETSITSTNAVKVKFNEKSYDSIKINDINSCNQPMAHSPISVFPTERDKASENSFSDQGRKTFQGFGTASGKPVKINEKSLHQARKMFSDIDGIPEESSEKPNIPKQNFQGFSTASGKSVKIEEKSLLEAKKMFIDMDEVIENTTDMQTSNKNVFQERTSVTNVDENAVFSFEKHNLSKPKIIEKSLHQARKMYLDIDGTTGESSEKPNIPKQNFQGFSTASGKSVKIDEKSLLEAKKMFIDIDEVIANTTDMQEIESSSTTRQFSNISNKNVFQEKTLVSNVDENAVFNFEKHNLSKPIVQGFGTASGNPVKITENFLHQARKMFLDIDEIPGESSEKHNIPKQNFQGFSTASGKSVKIDEKSLLEAKKMFIDIDEVIANTTDMQEIESSSTTGQTSNINNKNVFLNRAVVTNDIENSEKQNMSKPIFLGFGTASGKSVKINEKALQQARKIFADIDEDIKTSSDLVSNAYRISSDNAVLVSKELEPVDIGEVPLRRSCEIANNIKKLNVPQNEFQGRLVARGIPLQANEKLLQKSRKMFFNIEEETIGEGTNECYIDNIKSLKPDSKLVKHNEQKSDFIKKIINRNEVLNVTAVNKECEKESINKTLLKRESNFNQQSVNYLNSAKENYNNNEANTIFFQNNTLQKNDLKKRNYSNDEAVFKTPVTKRLKTDCYSNSKQSYSTPINHKNNLINDSITPNVYTPENYSLTQEISDSTSALMADEMANERPSWLTSFYVTDTSVLTDVSDCKSVVVTEDMTENFVETKQIQKSPVLGTNDRFINKRNIKKIKTRLSTKFNQVKDVSENQVDVIRKSSFTIPYKTDSLHNNSLLTKSFVEKDLEFATPFNKENNFRDESNTTTNHIISENLEIAEEVKQLRKMALEKQIRDIKYTKNRKLDKKPLKGSYLVTRTSDVCRNSWGIVAKGETPKLYSKDILIQDYKVRNSILSVNFNNAVDFIFNARDYYSSHLCQTNTNGILIGDGSLVILNEDSNISINEIIPAFLTSPGVDSNLVNEAWIKNHYKFIILKLAGMERNFPNNFANRALTPNNLLLQLKYRYDREIDRTQRSCLKKILENDDAPNKSMVLYCANIIPLETASNTKFDIEKQICYELELSDGWYSIRTQIDPPLSNAVRSNRLKIGDKIHVQGSQLLNCEQGCDPLEVPSDVRLRIYANSSLKISWDTKLGYFNSKPLAKCLGSVHPLGGTIQYTEFIVMRTYPLLYVERMGDKTVIRAERAELKISNEFEQKRQTDVESIYSQVQKAIEKESENSSAVLNKYKRVNEKDLKQINCGKTLTEIIEGSNDPTSIQDMLSQSQRQLVLNYYDNKRNEISKEIENRVNEIISNKPDVKKRQVIQLLKVQVVPICRENKPDHKSSAMLSVWRPSAEVLDILKENTPLIARHCAATGLRLKDLQLSSGRQASYKRIPIDRVNLNIYPTRTLTKISDINSSFSPSFNEIDTIGIVIHIGSTPNPSSYQTVYIADIEENVLAISFWNGLKEYGVEDLFNAKTIISCCNLQWKNNSFKSIPCVYATEVSTFTSNPKQKYLKEYFDMFIGSLDNIDKFVLSCEDKLYKSKTHRQYTPSSFKFGHNSSSPANNTPKRNMSANSTSFIPVMSPIQNRINKLQRYGEPPKLSPITLNKTKKVLRREFKVPLKINIESVRTETGSKVSKRNISPPLSLE